MALPLKVGVRMGNQTNKEANTTATETPAMQPVTCIKSFENDLWYRFTGEAAYQWYEVIVEPIECSTPAGLQALLIASRDCDPAHYRYVGCANPYENTNLRLILRDVTPGTPYLVQVDGYDGTQCDFAITLIGHTEPFRDFVALQCDYHQPTNTRDWNARLGLVNNAVQLQWEDDATGDVQGFLVERWHASPSGSHGAVEGRVAAIQRVMGGTVPYLWTDASGGWQNGDTLCYRLVRVLPSGPEYSALACYRVAGMITSLFITPPAILPENPAAVTAQYDNHLRQDITFDLLDSQMKPLKSLKREKVPKGLSSISVSMAPYPPGTYYLRTTVKEGAFLHVFEWKG
jgi:hypothetical protein